MRTLAISVVFQDSKNSGGDDNEFFYLARSLSALEIIKNTSLRVSKIDPAFFLSKGHIEDIRYFVSENNIGLILIDNPVTPVQQRNLEKKFITKVLDRTGLVLEIFGSRARTKEGMLQVELAHLLHQKSRLVRSWTHLERQRGGKGFLGGPGETQIESDRRSLTTKIVNIKKSLIKVKKTREVQRNLRIKNNLSLISFVGYTNAGKSTLFNAFPNKKTNSEDRLFSTLDPFLKKCGPFKKEYIISDTVGFIKNLPTSLVIAFRATLEEIIFSDLIIHVIDISDEYAEKKAETVYKTLEDLGINLNNEKKIIEVHNKIDISSTHRFRPFLKSLSRNDVHPVSASKKLGMDQLFEKIENILFNKHIKEQIVLDSSEVKKIQWLYQNKVVEASEFIDNNMMLKLQWSNNQKEKFNNKF